MKINIPVAFQRRTELASNNRFTVFETKSAYILSFALDANAYEIVIPKDSSPTKITIWPNVQAQLSEFATRGISGLTGRSNFFYTQTTSDIPKDVITHLANLSEEPLGIPTEVADTIIMKIPGLKIALDENQFVATIRNQSGPLATEIPSPVF